MAINNFNVGVGTTSQLTRYRYVATGGETSVSGTDADGKTLSYTVGLEQVFLNGVNLVRGQDYTATNGTSVGSLTALVASDVVEVFAFVPFNIANALTVSTVDAKGDLLVGTGADAVGRLAVGTNNQLLAADSSTGSGLKWANPGMTLINTTSFTTVSSQPLNNIFSATYRNYRIVVNFSAASASNDILLRYRVGGVSNSTAGSYGSQGALSRSGTLLNSTAASTSHLINQVRSSAPQFSSTVMDILNPFNAVTTTFHALIMAVSSPGDSNGYYLNGYHTQTVSYDGIELLTSTGDVTGVVSVYGYNN
jgi:hypothetical protein